MKKISSKCLLALAVVPFFCMCKKTNEVAQYGQVTITANIEDTKVSLTQGEEKLVLSWEAGDAINIIGETTQKFTIKDGFSAKSAEFTGNVVTGTSFDIVYPADYATKDAITARSYTGQVQNGNGSTAHLEYNAIIEGAADYQEISFAKGATGVKMNGALKLVVKLPDDVTAVSSLKLTAPSAIFYTTNGDDATTKSESLSMTFTNTSIGDDHILTAYMMTSWQDVTIAAGTNLTVDVTAPEQNSYYSKTFHCATDQTISGGATFVIDISSATTLAYTLKGSGTETDPYLLYTPQDMAVIRNFLSVTEKKYFKMMTDIDMTDVTGWKVLNDGNDKNGNTQYAHEINFNGNNKTIKNFTCGSQAYPSFFGVLIGECYDVTFENATVSQETASSSCAVIGGYAGTGGRAATVRNVTLKKCSVSYINTTGANVGIVAGNANPATFENVLVDKDCSLTVPDEMQKIAGGIVGEAKAGCTITKCANCADILTKKMKQVGGIVGRMTGNISECYNTGDISGTENVAGIVGVMCSGSGSQIYSITNCYSTGNLTNSGQMTGGISGNVCGYVDIKYCYATGSLDGVRVLGGIAGRLANDGWNGNTESKGGVNNLISCHVWNPSIKHTQTSAGGGSGTIIGYANRWNTYKGCYRAPWYGNNDPNQTALSVANEPNEIPVDQEDCSPSNPITLGIKGTTSARGALTMEHTWPYHGKVSSKEKLTDLVKTLTGDLAWDVTIWDLSGDYPTLKNNPEPTL